MNNSVYALTHKRNLNNMKFNVLVFWLMRTAHNDGPSKDRD